MKSANIFKYVFYYSDVADSILMYAITTGVFIGFGILLGASKMQRSKLNPTISTSSGESKKVKYTSDGRRIPE
ncbi:MAG: hypothetical protein WB511_00800 [Nitrososphaeraceae archaeon]